MFFHKDDRSSKKYKDSSTPTFPYYGKVQEVAVSLFMPKKLNREGSVFFCQFKTDSPIKYQDNLLMNISITYQKCNPSHLWTLLFPPAPNKTNEGLTWTEFDSLCKMCPFSIKTSTLPAKKFQNSTPSKLKITHDRAPPPKVEVKG